MSDALTRLRAAYDDRTAEARKRKSAGQVVVGYFLNSVPEELILAAGHFPVRLAGDPTRPVPMADRYMEDYFDGEVRALFDALIVGEFNFVDLIVIPRNSEVYLQLYYLLREIPKWEPDAAIPPLHLFDLLQSPYRSTQKYVIGRMRALADRLAALNGRAITDERLAEAIRTTNATRRHVVEASALWQGASPSLGGVDALKVIGAGSALGHEDYRLALRDLIDQPPHAMPQGRPRILLKGSPQSDARFTQLVERAGASVVAHDHVWGDRIYDRPIAEGGDPWEALAQHYIAHVPSPRAYPQAAEDARMLALARAARVEGAIIYHDEWDDTLGWEYPDQKVLLASAGIPSLFLKRQRWFDPPEDVQAAAVATFLAQIEQTSA